eukprot:COSAG01_NODE_7234_length_3290_cov_81.575682_3_plen_88_part_00
MGNNIDGVYMGYKSSDPSCNAVRRKRYSTRGNVISAVKSAPDCEPARARARPFNFTAEVYGCTAVHVQLYKVQQLRTAARSQWPEFC